MKKFLLLVSTVFLMGCSTACNTPPEVKYPGGDGHYIMSNGVPVHVNQEL